MDDKTTSTSVSRRSFVKGSFAAAAAAGLGTQLFQTVPALADAAPVEEEIHWSQCNVNCGGNCFFKWHSVDGKVKYMETDDTGEADLQSRACLRGRSMRRWLNHEQRLMYPMKRVGKRGEGKFEQISWDEAVQMIADKLKYTYETYGPNAVYVNYATGMYSATGKPGNRLLGLLGGYVNQGYDYSTHMLSAAMPHMFGKQFSPYDNVHASSFSEAANNSDMVVMFGNSPAETRMGGANAVWDFARVREAVTGRGGKIVQIDYRLNETVSGHPEEWLPIRPGTDAALVAAIAHEWIVNGQVDKEFLDTYCVGFDEDTMPESAKGQNKSYKDYVMGTGYDMVEKTPEWAAPITQISAQKIRDLAEAIAAAEAPFIVQGWGPQRHTNGEETARAISLLPCLIGKIGLPGTNTGQREAEPPIYLTGGLPASNPNPTTIPVFQWVNAVDHGHLMTATNAGVMGADELGCDIKFIWNYAGNCLTNQHGDINYTHEVLADESKCEFILVWDTVMTDSARYADLLLPDAMRSEQMNLQTQGYSEYWTAVGLGTAAQQAPGECRSSYDVCADIAEACGIREEFTEGKTHDDWIRELYEGNFGAAYDIELPSYEDMLGQGIFKMACEPAIGLKAFRDDPVANPLGTPSGKIEIYSETLAALDETWEQEFPEDHIHPIPDFHPGFEGYGCVTDEYPLYGTGFHHKSRTHSSYGFVEELEQVARQRVWINTADAEARGIANGEPVYVTSPVGRVRIEAYVTSRIVPGTVAIPQGAWHQADMYGDDRTDTGGCVNTLTAYHPSPLAKGNGTAHTYICQVEKA